MISQIGVVYVLGIAIDVFVIGMWFAPFAFSILEGMNYWPGVMPPPTKTDTVVVTEQRRATVLSAPESDTTTPREADSGAESNPGRGAKQAAAAVISESEDGISSGSDNGSPHDT